MGVFSAECGIGPIPSTVKCPKCGGKATVSSHNHVLCGDDGLTFPIWMPAGWYCHECGIIFCGLCKDKPLTHRGGDKIDVERLLDVEKFLEK